MRVTYPNLVAMENNCFLKYIIIVSLTFSGYNHCRWIYVVIRVGIYQYNETYASVEKTKKMRVKFRIKRTRNRINTNIKSPNLLRMIVF